MTERNWYSNLEQIGDELGLDDPTYQLARVLLDSCTIVDIGEGRSNEAMAGGAVYLAVRELVEPVSMWDITAAVDVEKKDVAAAYRDISEGLQVKIEPREPDEYVLDYAERLNEEHNAHLSQDAIAEAQLITTRGDWMRSPVSVAAGALYLAAQRHGKAVTQKEVGEATGISEIGVRAAVAEIREVLDE